MKKLLVAVSGVLAIGLFLIINQANAGNQTNWGTSTGANWTTPDDTTIQVGQALVITSSVPYPTVGTSSTTPMGIASFTDAQLGARVPGFLGQIVYCSDCANTPVCISTGVVVNSWASVVTSTTGVRNDCR